MKSATSEAVPAILDRHGEYSEPELSAFVSDAFPARISRHTAAAAGAFCPRCNGCGQACGTDACRPL